MSQGEVSVKSNEYAILQKYRKITATTREEIELAVKLGNKYLDITPAQKAIADARRDVYVKVDAMFEAMWSELNLDKTEEVVEMMLRNTTEAYTATNTSEAIAEHGHA